MTQDTDTSREAVEAHAKYIRAIFAERNAALYRAERAEAELAPLKAERDALREVVRTAIKQMEARGMGDWPEARELRAALKAGEGGV